MSAIKASVVTWRRNLNERKMTLSIAAGPVRASVELDRFEVALLIAELTHERDRMPNVTEVDMAGPT